MLKIRLYNFSPNPRPVYWLDYKISKYLIVFPGSHKINPGCINNQYWKIVLLGKKGKITLPDFFSGNPW